MSPTLLGTEIEGLIYSQIVITNTAVAVDENKLIPRKSSQFGYKQKYRMEEINKTTMVFFVGEIKLKIAPAMK